MHVPSTLTLLGCEDLSWNYAPPLMQGHRVQSFVCRGLAVLPGLGVVSASHDQTLRVWTFAGDCLATVCGHNAIIYRCCALNLIISALLVCLSMMSHGKKEVEVLETLSQQGSTVLQSGCIIQRPHCISSGRQHSQVVAGRGNGPAEH